MSRRQRNDHHATSPAFDFRGADDRLFRVITAFHDHVGSQMPYQIERRVLRKHYDQIDALQRGQNITSFGIAANRSRRPLEPAN